MIEESGLDLFGQGYRFLILRILQDGQGRLVHCELVDATGERIGHFRDLGRLVPLVEQWLEQPSESTA